MYETTIVSSPLNQYNWNPDQRFEELLFSVAPSWPRPCSVINERTLVSRLGVSELAERFVYLSIHFWDLAPIAEFADRTDMVCWCFHRMLLLLELAGYLLANSDTDQCQDCQTPLIQTRYVPWHHLLKNTTYYFSGIKFKKMIRVLPNNSFVSGSYIQARISNLSHIVARGICRFGFVLCCFVMFASLENFFNYSIHII